MIVQCNECQTKFKLDDSKVTHGGVKVRCAKCKHVFLVKREAAADEELDLDKLLSGIGGSSQGEEADADEGFDLSGLTGGAASQDEDSFNLTSFAGGESDEDEQPGQKRPATEIRGALLSAPEPETSLEGEDEGSFASSFGSGGEGVATNATAAFNASGGDEFDFNDSSSFSFDSDSSTPTAAHDDGDGMDFGGVDFNSHPDGFAENQVASSLHDAFASETPATGKADSSFAFDEQEWGGVSSAGEVTTQGGENAELADLFGYSGGSEPQPADAADMGLDWQLPVPPVETQGGQNQPDSLDFDLSSLSAPPQQAKAEALPSLATDSGYISPESAGGSSMAIVFADSPPVSSSISFALDDDEPPPLMIPSRRKGSSLPLIIVGTIIALFLLMIGGGYLLLRVAPELAEQYGITAVATALHIPQTKVVALEVTDLRASFVTGPDGELFVIRGRVTNKGSRPLVEPKVKATLLRQDGSGVTDRVAVCAGDVADDQLMTLPLFEVEKFLVQTASTDKPLAPGGTIPFIVIIKQVSADVVNFAVVPAPVEK